jgi:anti-anti-sigma factor
MAGVTDADSLSLGRDGRGIFLSARGSIRAPLCAPLREELLGLIEEEQGIPAVYADLSGCRYMDSTFIGLLVAADRRLRKASGGRLHVVRPSAESLDLLRQIGLQEYLLVEDAAIEPPGEMRDLSSGAEKPAAEFVLRVHEALMETSEEARKKFATLKEVLEKKIRAEKPPRDTP